MKISFDHILKFLDVSPKIEEISEKLFQLGHEHSIEKNIFDFEFTPNRGDCLSLNGLARELGVFYSLRNDLKIYESDIPKLDLDFQNYSKSNCPRISFLKIKIDKRKKVYEDYLESYFTDLNINKNNFFTDISNYLAYELGQPTHCYDYSKLGKKIILKSSTSCKEFKTLLGNKITLEGKNTLFFSDNLPINLAGIVGGKSTACSADTDEVLVECAYFKPDFLMGKSVAYNVVSDAAYKFERNVDQASHEKVLRRFINIVADHAEIVDIGLYVDNNSEIKNKEISFDASKINKIIGINLSDNHIKNIFYELGFKFQNNKIVIPSHRNDIEHINDLAEEIARVFGYDNVPIKEIKIPNLNKGEDKKNELIKSFMIDNGFYETINNPFLDISNKNSIKVDNPLDSSRKYLRNSLKESLIKNLIFNSKRQQDSIKFFEISDLYYIENNKINVMNKIGIIASGRVAKNYKDFSKKIDKNYLESIFIDLFNVDENKFLEISSQELGLKTKYPIFFIEIESDNVKDTIIEYLPISKKPSKIRKFDGISEFPSTSRDLSFLVKDIQTIKKIEEVVYNIKLSNLKEVYAFDFFENHDKNQIKIGFRFIFQSRSNTLSDEQVDKIFRKVISKTLEIDGLSIPGIN